MEDKKIITTERELSMAVAHASLLMCHKEEYKHIKDTDIMSVAASISTAVENHLTGREEFDPEEYKATKIMYEAAEALESGPATVITIRREP